jgi:hypothetical protein
LLNKLIPDCFSLPVCRNIGISKRKVGTLEATLGCELFTISLCNFIFPLN